MPRDRALCPACGDDDDDDEKEGSMRDENEDRFTNTVEDAAKFERRRIDDDRREHLADLRRDAERDAAEDERHER